MYVGIHVSYRVFRSFLMLLGLIASATQALAFDSEWKIDGDLTKVYVHTVVQSNLVETSQFTGVEGTVRKDGQARIVIDLETLDTGNLVRDTLVKKHFLRTHQQQFATLSAVIGDHMVSDLKIGDSKKLVLPVTVEFAGRFQEMMIGMLVKATDADRISVFSDQPVAVEFANYGMMPGVELLEGLNDGLSILPAAALTFELNFERDSAQAPEMLLALGSMARIKGAVDLSLSEPVAPVIDWTAPQVAKPAMPQVNCENRFFAMVTTGRVQFTPDSTDLTDDSLRYLDRLTKPLKECSDLTLEIVGHTDGIGDPLYNKHLSEMRALSVYWYLVAKGVPKARLSSVGFGAARPLLPNTSPENRSLNRRIDFILTQG